MNLSYIFRNSWWSKRKRPKTKIGFTVFDLIIEIVGLVAVLALWIFVMVTFSKLPDIIPIHLNASGQADNFGEKSKLLELPVIATILYAGMTIFSRFPHFFNYPVKITENNADFQYRNMARMIRCLKLSLVLVFGNIVLQTARNDTGNVEGLGGWFLPLILAVIFLPVLYFMVKSFLYR